ncbi:MAG: tocopherol cyclase family protein [Christensenellaceae bacterium]|nr:tocopherol cyclase family protein [Christensenellaceae bacterium]MEA5067631.1 tocopherol cyclase family protein [Christensenellaceae bacterium]
MRMYHGGGQDGRRASFEGWYFKHRIGDRVLAVIPGLASDGAGGRKAFVQVISNEGAAFHAFPCKAFRARADRLSVEVGANRFDDRGVSLALPGLRAELTYGAMTKLSGGDIMGPFRFVPFMECNHSVISLKHPVDGYVELGGAVHRFDGGSGYLEMDWGRSFPRDWTWFECHDFEGRPGDSLMLAVAEIPMLGLHFTGIIAVCRVDGRQHRVATYRGARVQRSVDMPGRCEIALIQGGYRLELAVDYDRGGALRAPVLGRMDRTITEYPSCRAHALLSLDGRTLLDAPGRCAGFERAQSI